MNYLSNGTTIGETHKSQVAYSLDGSTWKYFSKGRITDVDGYGTIVKLSFADGSSVVIDLTVIQNQPTWTTGDDVGLNNAINDISQWVSEVVFNPAVLVEIQNTLENMQTSDTDVQDKLSGLKTALDNIKAVLDNSQDKLSSIQTAAGNTSDAQGIIETALEGIHTVLDSIKSVSDTIQSALETLQTDVGASNTSLSSIGTSLNDVHSSLSDIKTTLDNMQSTLNDTKSLAADLKKYLNGQNGFSIISPPDGLVNGNWYLVKTLDDTVFSSFVDNSQDLALLQVLQDQTLPQGTNLTTSDFDGNGITTLGLSSGKIIAYKK